MNPSLFESLDKRLEGDVDLARNLIQAFPGVVSIHNVVNVNRSQWAGHVYDLQTKSGWIVSQGIVTSNCMVVRTNYATATSAGRFREAEEVQASGIPTGFRYVTAGDSNVRPGHAALDGLVASVTDPIWMRFSPPGGFQCRCTLQVLVGDEVPKRHVRVPAGAQFEPGFGTRADLVHYG
jgi:SPP1 gp7 family putative phage head morphogenesis protein